MIRMGRILNIIHGLKAAMMMVMVQISMAGLNVFYKVAANDGMSMRVLVAYRFIFAAAFIVPLAFYLDRNSRPKLTWIVFWQAFFTALVGGSVAQNLYAESLILTSATFASATTNLIPALTFLMAIFFRLEKLGLDNMVGKVKVLGTLISIGGAMLLTFYKGTEINVWHVTVDLLHNGQLSGGHVASSHRESINHILGALFALIACVGCALSLIFQAKMSERYPCPYSSTALISVTGSVQAVVIAFCLERDWGQWKLGWDIRLLASAYSGTVTSGLMVTFIMWCVHIRGPLYVSAFNPLLPVLVAIAGCLLLKEKLYLGSIVGAVIIVCGLYMVLWGKGKELKRITQLKPSETEQNEGPTNSCVENNKYISNILAVSPNFLPIRDDAIEEGLPVKNEIEK